MGDKDTYTRFEMVQEPGANMKDQASIQTSECGGSFDTCCFSRRGSGASIFHGGLLPRLGRVRLKLPLRMMNSLIRFDDRSFSEIRIRGEQVVAADVLVVDSAAGRGGAHPGGKDPPYWAGA